MTENCCVKKKACTGKEREGTRNKGKALAASLCGDIPADEVCDAPSDLDLRRVHHHAELARDRRRRQVVRKLCTDDTAVAVEVDDLAPHDAVCVLAYFKHQVQKHKSDTTV